jgi:hypothetical protein
MEKYQCNLNKQKIMKNIEPLTIWKNGQSLTASVLDAIIINDNLSTSCTFYWMLKEDLDDEVGQTLADGNTTMTGEEYEGWDGSNDYAFNYIASQINVTIV